MLSWVYQAGVHVGYRITCRRHNNATDDPTQIQCQKDITMGKTAERLSEEECILRLKRWFIAGTNRANEEAWRGGEMRTRHLAYGGRPQLRALATGDPESVLAGVDENELDEMCTHLGIGDTEAAPGLAGVA